MCRPFSVRMWHAIRFIESGAEHSRQLDEAFENSDGDAMSAALHTMAQKRPKLATNLPKYVVPIEQSIRAKTLMGKTLPELRAIAKADREAFQKA